MSPKVLVCLLISIMFGTAALVLAIVIGWGVLVGFVAYSLVGSLTLIGSVVAASFLESRRQTETSALSQHIATDVG